MIVALSVPIGLKGGIRHGQQPHLGGVCLQPCQGAVQPRCQFGPDPNDQICLGQGLRLTWAQLKIMGVTAFSQQEVRRPQIAHHRGYKRVNRRNIRDDSQSLGLNGRGQ